MNQVIKGQIWEWPDGQQREIEYVDYEHNKTVLLSGSTKDHPHTADLGDFLKLIQDSFIKLIK